MAGSPVSETRSGLSYWMEQVLEECDKAFPEMGTDPVHDLRTALRRCRSMAEGIRVLDRDPAWKKMRRAGKQLFSSLGDLRDTHVMREWVQKLAPENDASGRILAAHLSAQEQKLKQTAALALQEFDRKQWKAWAGKLPDRAARIPLNSPIFAHLALERWHEARVLHHRALRNRSHGAFHELRIGLKRFRYIVENFLPSLYERWGDALKNIQDVLGEAHDLGVLWQTAVKIQAFPDGIARNHWRGCIEQERRERLDSYHATMTGKKALWAVWREALPEAEELRAIGLERVKIWASFLDGDAVHSKHVTRLALQLYDNLPDDVRRRAGSRESGRSILQVAALGHEVGRSRVNHGHHKASARLLRKLQPPLGWTSSELRLASLIARYHRGALPRPAQKRFRALFPTRQSLVQFLAGILRLACACDWQHDRTIRRLRVQTLDSALVLRATGYVESTALAEHLAAARHLLELACGRAILILPAEEKAGATAA
jgi:exopolyphosphatase/guanosine-5'-triphosphate,3'-diphosphate pyrophosphatase